MGIFLPGEENLRRSDFKAKTAFCFIYIYLVCDHEITQAMQFAETRFQHSCINRNLRNFIELLSVRSVL